MAKKGVDRSNKFKTPYLFLSKMLAQRLCQDFAKCGMSYEETMQRVDFFVPEFRAEYKRVNGVEVDYADNIFKRKVCDNPRRRRHRKQVNKATALDELLTRIITKGEPVTISDVESMNVQEMMKRGKSLEHLYGLRTYRDESCTKFAGTKIGQTIKPDHRFAQIRNELYKKKRLYAKEEYVCVFQLDLKHSMKKEAVRLQNAAKRLCEDRGAKILQGMDYLDADEHLVIWAITQVLVSEDIPIVNVTDECNSHRRNNVVKLRA